MNIKVYATSLAALLVVAALGTGTVLHMRPSAPPPKIDPADILNKRLDSIVLLRPEQQQFVDLTLGTQANVQALVNANAGETAQYHYRQSGPGKGLIDHALIYYPATKEQMDEYKASAVKVETDEGSYTILDPKKQPRGPLKRDVTLDTVGTYLTDRVYWVDGKIKHRGDRIDEETYQQADFYENGVASSQIRFVHVASEMYKRRKFNPLFHLYGEKLVTEKMKPVDKYSWIVQREEDRYPSGNLSKLMVRSDDNSVVVDELTDSGVTVSHMQTDSVESTSSASYYQDDGKTLVKKIEQGSVIKIHLYKDGRLIEDWLFYYRYTLVENTVYDSKGKPVLRRMWDLKKPTNETTAGKIDPSLYFLSRVQLFDKGVQWKQYSFWKNGKLSTVEERDPGKPPGRWVMNPGKQQMYNEDGVMWRAIREAADGNIIEEHNFDPAQGIQPPEVDPKLLEPKAFPPVPAPLPNASEEDGGPPT